MSEKTGSVETRKPLSYPGWAGLSELMEATVLDAKRAQTTFTQQTFLNTFYRPVLEIKSVRLRVGGGNLWLQCIQEPRTGLPSFRKQGYRLYSIWLATAQTDKAGMGQVARKVSPGRWHFAGLRRVSQILPGREKRKHKIKDQN